MKLLARLQFRFRTMQISPDTQPMNWKAYLSSLAKRLAKRRLGGGDHASLRTCYAGYDRADQSGGPSHRQPSGDSGLE